MHKTDHSTAVELYQSHSTLVDRFLIRSQRRFPKLRRMPTLRSHLEEALWRSANKFDPSRGTQFSTFVYHRLHGCILDLVRKRCRSKEPFVRNPNLQMEYERNGQIDSPAEQGCAEHRMDVRRTADRIRKILATVETTSGTIVTSHIIKGQSLRSIARDLALPYSEVRRRYQAVLTHIRHEMGVSPPHP